jgi:hypothetical protein
MNAQAGHRQSPRGARWDPRIPLEDGLRLTVEYFQGMHAPVA